MNIHTKNRPNVRLNFRVALISIIAIIIAVPLVFVWNQKAKSVLSESILTQVQQAIVTIENRDPHGGEPSDGQIEADADAMETAVKQVRYFLNLHPDHVEAKVLLAQCFDKTEEAKSNPRANIQLHVDALAVSDKSRNELLSRVAELFSQTGRFTEAREAAEELVIQQESKSTDTTNGLNQNEKQLTARCYQSLATAIAGELRTAADKSKVSPLVGNRSAGTLFDLAIELNPENIDLPCSLAGFYRDTENRNMLSPEQRLPFESANSVELQAARIADKLVSDMVARNSENAQAYLASYRYKSFYEIEFASDDLIAAAKVDTQDPQVNLLLGVQKLDQAMNSRGVDTGDGNEENKSGDANFELLSQAKSHFETAIQGAPDSVEAYFRLGIVHEQMGELALAINVWSTGLEISQFKDPVTFHRLTSALIQSDSAENLSRAKSLLEQMSTLTKEIARRDGIDQGLLHQWIQSQQFLSALIQYREKEFGKAIESLEAITRDQALKDSKTNEFAHKLLTEIYLGLGRSSDASVHLATLDRTTGTSNPANLIQIGEVYLDAGNYAQAITMLTRAANSLNNAEAWRLLAHAIYLQQLKEPVQLRQWSIFDRTIERARAVEAETDSWKTTVLNAMSKIYRVENPTFETIAEPLESLQKIASQNPEIQKQLAAIYNQLGDFEKADKWLSQYMSQDLPITQTAIAKAQLLAQRDNFKQASDALALAMQANPTVEERKQLTIANANIKLQTGQSESGFSMMRDLVIANPDDGKLLFDLVELAFRIGKIDPTPADWESQLKVFEPPTGQYSTVLKAARLTKRAQNATTIAEKTRLLASAHNLLSEIDDLAKHWPLLNLLRGDVFFAEYEATVLKEGQDTKRSTELVEQTKSRYERAVALGERDTRTILRLAFLANDRAESKKWSDLVDMEAQNVNLLGAKLRLAYRQSSIDEARRLGELYTKRSPDNPVGWIQRAFLEWTLKNYETAEQHAAKSEALLEERSSISLGAWQSVFNFRVNASATARSIAESDTQLEHAQRLITKIVSLTPENERLIMEAKLLAATDSPTAGDKFLLAEKKDPNNVKTLQSVVEYFASSSNRYPGALDHAVRIMETLTKLDAQNRLYRKTLATLLARRGLESDWVRIKSFYKEDQSTSMADARVLAILLLQKSNVTNSERIADLKSADELIRSQSSQSIQDNNDRGNIAHKRSAQIADWMLLGFISDAWSKVIQDKTQKQARVQEATTQFNKVVHSEYASLQQLYQIGLFFLRNDNITEAEKLAEQIETKISSRGKLSPFSVALRAQLIATQQPDKKEEMIAHRIESLMHQVESSTGISQREKLGWYLAVAKICDQAQLHGLGVKWYRKASSENPELMAGLVNALLTSGEYLQAMGILTENYQSAPTSRKPLFVAGIANVLIQSRALSSLDDATNDSLYEIASPVLDQAKSAFPNNLSVLVNLANVQLAALGNVQNAIELYQEARKIDPRNTTILNNLATVLSDDPAQLNAALQTIDEAIKLGGSKPHLIDTKAVILRKLDRLQESEKLLVNIVHSEADSRYWWHLSEVHLQRFQANQDTNQVALARKYLQTAIDNGLEDSILTPGEKSRLLKLKNELGSNSPSVATNSQKLEHTTLKVSTNVDANEEQ